MHVARHAGNHFVITGAGTGIGRAIALRLASEGANISMLARDESRLEATASQIRERYRVGVMGTHCDIRDRSAVEEAVAAAATLQGPIHGFIANAGIGGPNEDGPDDRFDDLIATNLSGTYYCLRAAIRELAPAPARRNLLVVSSVLGRFGVPGYTGYCASKTGLIGLVRALAHELAEDQVQVNALCPGWVNTEMARDGIQSMATGMGVTYDEAFEIAMQEVPLRRMSEPEEVAGVVSWLLSADARGVTGQAVDVNGGAFMG